MFMTSSKQRNIYYVKFKSSTILTFKLKSPGGGGELAYVMIRGCAIILGTFLGVAPGFLGIMFWLFLDFWVSFFGKTRFL